MINFPNKNSMMDAALGGRELPSKESIASKVSVSAPSIPDVRGMIDGRLSGIMTQKDRLKMLLMAVKTKKVQSIMRQR